MGKKPVSKYVIAATRQISIGARKIVLKARGSSIPKAVDVAEALRRRFADQLSLESIKTYTETLETENGTRRVSVIEIVFSV